MTARQIVNVDVLKAASAEFTTMRHLAMRSEATSWRDGGEAGHLAERRRQVWRLRYAALCQDIAARYRGRSHAVLEPWSNGQTEGQINKLKTLKRAMYGRASVDLLRARMMPLRRGGLHRE